MDLVLIMLALSPYDSVTSARVGLVDRGNCPTDPHVIIAWRDHCRHVVLSRLGNETIPEVSPTQSKLP